ncbi:MAG TPA: hypothetical protein VFT04_15105 [Gemmatimonadales bacterium]|nr:hypothetical protein [Gemmatimonadales bacterium]
MPSLITLLLPVGLALAAILSGALPARRLAWLSVVVYALGAASVRVALRLPIGQTADPLWIGALPITSLRIDGGLQVLGAMLALGAAVVSLRVGRASRDRAAAFVALTGAVAIIVTAVPLLRLAGWPPALAAAIAIGSGLGIIGGVIVVIAGRLAMAGRRDRPREQELQPAHSGRWWGFIVAAGAVAAIAAPHLDLVIGGAIAAAIAAHLLSRRAGAGGIPFFPAVATGALAFAGYYLHVIAGPAGVSLSALPDAPLSNAAQALLVPALAVGAAGYFGIWPLAALTPGAWLAPIGVALLLRVGAESLPLGIEGWRTVAIPIGVLAAWAAALGRRPLALAAAGAWMACFASTGAGAENSGPAGAWLLALVPVIGVRIEGGMPGRARGALSPLQAAVVAIAGVLGATLALDALLRAEVVYAVLAAAAAAAAISAVYISPVHT